MALVNCPECNNKVSDSSNFCPSCGYKFNERIGYTSNQYKGKKIIMAGKGITILGVIILLGSRFEGTPFSLSILLIITGMIISRIGKIKNWYHN